MEANKSNNDLTELIFKFVLSMYLMLKTHSSMSVHVSGGGREAEEGENLRNNKPFAN